MAIVNVTLRIQYNANGGTNAPSITITRIKAIESDLPKTLRAEVSTQFPTRDGFQFLGWSTSASATTASYSGGDVLTHTFSNWTGSDLTYTIYLYAVWKARTYFVTYAPGTYGSGSTVVDSKDGGTDLTLRGKIFTRTGYNQTGWSLNADGSGFAYSLGGKYSANASITLYPYWSIIKSTITSVTDSVPADGTTQGTVLINKPNADFSHTVLISLGTRSQEFTNVDTSLTFTIPAAWLDQIPNATSAVATVSLTTYKNGSRIGTPDTKSFVVTVPETVVPTITLTGTNQSSNSTVSGWNVLVQGYSQIALTAAASAGSGATITSIAFSGEGVSQIGAGTTVTSELLTSAGSKTWTATVTDSRGRTATATLTRTVHEYYPTAILAFSAFRSTQEGNASPSGGLYITASGNYSFASCDGHNTASVKKIEYKMHNDSTWTQGEGAAASGTVYTFGPISLLYIYDVRLTVTDALGSSAAYTVNVASVRGVSFGLNGRCARFGGPVQYDDRFECDWDMQVDGQVEMPLFLQTGVVASENIASGTTKTIDIEFETEFATQPYVAVSIMSPQTTGLDACAVTAWNITQTGFSARLINGYEATRQLGICWIATARKDTKVAIITQPIDQSADIGDRVTFAVEAVNATAYQWYYRATSSGEWTAISGDSAKLAQYSFIVDSTNVGYQYKCVVSNSKGSVDSDVVKVSAGREVTWNQHASMNASDWLTSGASISFSGTTTIVTATRSTSLKYGYFELVENHKYFVGGTFTSHNTLLVIGFFSGTSGNTYSWREQISATAQTFETIKPNSYADGYFRFQLPTAAASGDTGDADKLRVIDLTDLLGATEADEIYAMEQAEAGSGVAYFKSMFADDIYDYVDGQTVIIL